MEEARLQQGAHCRLIRAFWAWRPLLFAPTEGPPLTTDLRGQWGPQLSAAANVLNSLGGSFLKSRWHAKGIISFQHGGKGRKWQPLTRLLTQSKELELNCCEGRWKRNWSATGVGENKGSFGQVHNSARSIGQRGHFQLRRHVVHPLEKEAAIILCNLIFTPFLVLSKTRKMYLTTKQWIILYFSRLPDLKIVRKFHAETFLEPTVSSPVSFKQ